MKRTHGKENEKGAELSFSFNWQLNKKLRESHVNLSLLELLFEEGIDSV